MNIDRFVFAFAAAVILISFSLGYFYTPYWFLLTAFAILNLFQAAFTGFCPLAMILKRFGLKSGSVFKKGDFKTMGNIKPIDCATLKAWIDNNEAIVIDVREIEEYNAAHIKDAILIPVGTCSASSVPHNPDKKIVFHCKAGIRGGKACEVCAGALPEKAVYNLEGGLDRWIAEGYPVVSG